MPLRAGILERIEPAIADTSKELRAYMMVWRTINSISFSIVSV
jgi:hypothetical protein